MKNVKVLFRVENQNKETEIREIGTTQNFEITPRKGYFEDRITKSLKTF